MLNLCLKFDEFLIEYKLSIHRIDGKRLLRWVKHQRSRGEWDMEDIERLENSKLMLFALGVIP